MDDLINTEEKVLHSLEMVPLKWLINMVGTALLIPSPFMWPTTPDQHTINIQGWHRDRGCGSTDSWILIASVWLVVKAVRAALFGYLLKVKGRRLTSCSLWEEADSFFFNLHIRILPTAERERPCEANQPHLDFSQLLADFGVCRRRLRLEQRRRAEGIKRGNNRKAEKVGWQRIMDLGLIDYTHDSRVQSE